MASGGHFLFVAAATWAKLYSVLLERHPAVLPAGSPFVIHVLQRDPTQWRKPVWDGPAPSFMLSKSLRRVAL